MLFWKIVPFVLGFLMVLQAGMNRMLFPQLGLGKAVLFNSLFLLGFLAVAYGVFRVVPVPEVFEAKKGGGAIPWWIFAPGLCGLFIVGGSAVTLKKVGASYLFVALVASQMVFSLVWDRIAENRPIGLWQVAGACLAIVAAVLVGIHREP